MLVTGGGGREDPYLGSVEGVVGPWRAWLCTVHRGTFHFVISSYLQPVHGVCVHQGDAAEEMEESGGLWLVPGSADGATNHTAVFKRRVHTFLLTVDRCVVFELLHGNVTMP